MFIRLFGTAKESIVDGPGFRYTVFTQGCPHACPGCHNPDSHAMQGGYAAETEDIIAEFTQNKLLRGITLSGGEPFMQSAACAVLAKAAREAALDVWVYSGYTFEQLLAMPDAAPLLRACDVLVDGLFTQNLRTLDTPFRGSKNQRLIDLPASLGAGRAVEYHLAI